ncbi:MAG: S-layer homology domain-containing protein [Bacillota bacterium]|nr:S-layer homology domain-containing protein [Bacillota bacterium]
MKQRKGLTLLLVLAIIFSQLFVPLNIQAYGKDIYEWSVVGTAGFSKGYAWETYLQLDNNGIPYIIYQDRANDSKATVMKYADSSWQVVGTTGFSDGQVEHPTIAFDSTNTPYAAYRDGGNSYGATVKKFNGSNWVDVGTPGFSEDKIDYIKIAFSNYNDTPHVIYQDQGSVALGRATVMQYSSQTSQWENLGGVSVGVSDSKAFFTDIVINSNNDVYIAYKDGSTSIPESNGGAVTVRKFSFGGTWQDVGLPAFSDGEVNYVDLEMYNGVPYVAFQDKANEYEITVMKYNGTNWEVIGDKGFTEDGYSYLYAEEVSLKIDSDGNLYVATLHDQYFDSFIVYKYINSQWTEIGTYPVTTDYTYSISLDVDSENNLYVGFRDGEHLDKATVMKYSQPEDQVISSPYISGIEPIIGETPVTSIETSQYTGTITWSPNDSAFDYETAYTAAINLTPKLGYKLEGITENFFDVVGAETTTNDANSGLITAEFPITYANWQMVGSSFTDEYTSTLASEDSFYIGDLDIALDSQGIPYIALTYQINEEDRKSAVKKYENNQWIDLDSESLPLSNYGYIQIEVGNDDHPIIAYYDKLGDLGNIDVKKWDGASWQVLGNTSKVGSSSPGNFDLKDGSGGIYLAYSDWEGEPYGSASIIKYDGSDWTSIGYSVTSGSAFDLSLDIDSSDNPIISYVEIDSDNLEYTSSVKKYNGSNWEALTNSTYSYTESYEPHQFHNDIKVNSSDIPYLAYSDPDNNYEVTVKKWNGSSFEIVGNYGFTEDSNDNYVMTLNLEIDNSSNPIVAVEHNTLNEEYVYKYKFNQWIPLRSEYFNENLNYTNFDTYQNKGYLIYSTYDGLWHGHLLEYTPTESYTPPPTPSPRSSIPKLVIEIEEFPEGIEGEEYEYQLEGNGGREPYTWNAEGLPEGLEITEDGQISGVPEEAGTFNVKIELLDSRSYYRSKTLKLFIEEKEEEPIEIEEEFTDVTGHWFIEFLRDIFDRNIIFGYPDRTFRPNNKVTRGEFAAMIIRTFEIDPIEGSLFDDTSDNWAESSINGAVGRGIITGYEDNTFRPNAPITREEMAAMISRALKLEEDVVEDYFEDIDKASPWAQLSIRRLGNSKILTGFPDGTFRPKDNLTRAEAVKIIYEILQDLEDFQ